VATLLLIPPWIVATLQDIVAALKERIAWHVSQRYQQPQSRKYHVKALPALNNHTWPPGCDTDFKSIKTVPGGSSRKDI
jgi:hypothetical protein